MGVFAYVILLASEENCIIIFIDLVLLMGWVDSPKYFCAISETLTDVVNALVHTSLPVPGYGVIYKIPETVLGLPYTLDSLTHIYCCMDDVVTAVKG